MSQVAVEAKPQAPPRLREVMNRKLFVLFSVLAIRTVAGYLVLPFIVLYFHLVLGFSLVESGVLLAIGYLAGMALGVVGGFLADRLGAVRAMVAASLVSALAVAGLGFVPPHDLLAVIVLMVVWGAMRPVGSSTMGALANMNAAPEHRGTVQNYMYWLGNASVLVGLVIGAEALGAGRSALPLFVMAAVYVLAVVPLYGAFRNDLKPKPKAAAGDDSFRTRMGLLVRDRALLMTGLAMLVVLIGEDQMSSTVPLSLAQHFNNGAQLYGPLRALNPLVVVVGQPLLSRFTARVKPTRLYLLGVLLSGGGLAFGGLEGTVAAWVAGMVIYTVGEVLWALPLHQVMSELPVAGREVLYFSVVGLFSYFAGFIGPAAGTAVLAADPTVLWLSMPVVGLLGAWAFSDATRALKRRATATQTVDVRAAGYEAPAEAAAPLAEVPTFEAAGAVVPTARISEVPMFGVAVKAAPIVFLESVAPEERERIWSYGTTETVAAGAVLVTAGSSERTLYLVEEGELDVLVGEEGRERRLTVMDAGSVFGEQAFVDGQPRSASIRATGPCVVRQLTWDRYQALAAEHPKLAHALLWDVNRVVSERLRRTTEALSLLSA